MTAQINDATRVNPDKLHRNPSAAICIAFISLVLCRSHPSAQVADCKLFLLFYFMTAHFMMSGIVLIKWSSRFQSGIEISSAKCISLPQRRMLPQRRDNHQWHEKEMSYWYSYETNVSKHAISSVQQDEILNIHLPFTVIIELQRDGTIKGSFMMELYEEDFCTTQLCSRSKLRGLYGCGCMI